MKRFIRKFVPQIAINIGKHLPASILANLKYSFPSKGMIVIGVTGTDGKTTTTNMIYQILKAAGKNVSMISTINAVIGDKNYDTGFHVTSPSPFQLQKYIKEAKKKGSEYLVLEVTSHALDQFRVWGIKFDIGVITNITHEHLDYHKTFENYFKAKAKVIKKAKVAVLNFDEKHFTRLSELTFGKVVSFGLTKDADFNPYKFLINLKLLGKFNLLNALASAAVCISLGIEVDDIKRGLEKFETLSGRMEEIKNSRGIKIFVDFAHTPYALEQALRTLRTLTAKNQKLISVFGCAGERDFQKRPMMGEISANFSDITILTDEDPRFEDSNKIIKEIVQGVLRVEGKVGKNLFTLSERKKAIELALKLARRGDVIGIFGKGHEKSMNYFGSEKPWSDQKAVLDILHG